MSLAQDFASHNPLELVAKDLSLQVGFQASNYANVALLFMLIYDHALTFEGEVKYIWSMKWALPKIFVLINRYGVPPFIIRERQESTNSTVGDICMYASLSISCSAKIRSSFQYSCRYLYPLPSWLSYTRKPLLSGCLYVIPVPFEIGLWVPSLTFEAILIGMTILKTRGFGNAPDALKILIRDSVFYFLSIFICLLVPVVLPLTDKYIITPQLVVPLSTVSCIGVTPSTRQTMTPSLTNLSFQVARLTINIREVMASRQEQFPPTDIHVVSNILIRGPKLESDVTWGSSDLQLTEISKTSDARRRFQV
ncbi:hypothetical protein CC1G_02361 [Coprinopsis cinerea okayama7|uniref:DUF6533 domain-containing protein n=1 Tax=Coprinopsis cinerea (strain Okayama-7 / 130 / ATCC MYA-4618 / FGSC 9003) TaxID=240176 RepID=A8N7V4_COPC7|nr:hypothetical protein CC1G_02361 [Coprinopsis cinerea okayama7\|eukprot:XP_001830910.2 hypothetical protein CC1G_02361 [Coprinopsis cinerea okayama7\